MARLDLAATDGQTPRATARHAVDADGALLVFDLPEVQVSRAASPAAGLVEAGGPVEADTA